MNNKIIILDFGIFLHRSIFATLDKSTIPSTYTCLASIIGCLKRIGVNSEDKVLVAVDYLKSWRKEFEPTYKADRKAKREKSPIDWDYEYKEMNKLLDNLDEATKFHIIKVENCEADDIMAVASRYFKDQEIVLVTYDSDLEQMWEYQNVKIFSPKTKRYKIIPNNFNVYSLISKKIKKEVADNLSNPILNENDYDNRTKCISLLELPDWVEEGITKELIDLPEKKEELVLLFFPSLKKRFPDIYNPGTEPYEKSVRYNERKKKKLLKKKALKRGAKK